MSTARTDCDSHVLEVRESELVTVLGGVRSSGCCATVRECQTKCVSRGCSEICEIHRKILGSVHPELVTSPIEQDTFALCNLNSNSGLDSQVSIDGNIVTIRWINPNRTHLKIPDSILINVCRDISSSTIEWNHLRSD